MLTTKATDMDIDQALICSARSAGQLISKCVELGWPTPDIDNAEAGYRDCFLRFLLADRTPVPVFELLDMVAKIETDRICARLDNLGTPDPSSANEKAYFIQCCDNLQFVTIRKNLERRLSVLVNYRLPKDLNAPTPVQQPSSPKFR